MLLSKLFFIDLMPKSFKKIVSRIFFSMLVYAILFSVFIFLKDKYLHYKFLSHVISSLEELIKDISPLITASIAVYIGHEARKITKEQKEIAKNKLIIDIHDKRVQFLILANKSVQEFITIISYIDTLQRYKEDGETKNKMKTCHDELKCSSNTLISTFLELQRIHDTNEAFYLEEEYEIMESIIDSFSNILEKLSKGIKKLNSNEPIVPEEEELQKMLEDYLENIFSFKEKIEKNISHMIKTHFS